MAHTERHFSLLVSASHGKVFVMTITEHSTIIETGTAFNLRVSNEIRSWLGRRQITQKRLAQMLDLSATSLSFRMKGKTPWSIGELAEVSSWLGISLAQLLGEELVNEKNPHPMDEGSSEVAGGSLDLPTSRL